MGCHDEIKSFLREFEEMTNLYNVPTTEHFDLVTCYISHQVSEVIEGLTEYHSKNWQDFVTQMKKLYNHAKTEKRYTQRDLDSFISDKTHKFIHDLSNFRKYQCGFLRIGRWLLQHQKIMDEQFRKSFWMGLPKHIRNRLESCQVHPTLSLTTPFPIEYIIEAAEHVYDPTHIDTSENLTGHV